MLAVSLVVLSTNSFASETVPPARDVTRVVHVLDTPAPERVVAPHRAARARRDDSSSDSGAIRRGLERLRAKRIAATDLETETSRSHETSGPVKVAAPQLVVHEETKASASHETSGPVRVAPPELVVHEETDAPASHETSGPVKVAPPELVVHEETDAPASHETSGPVKVAPPELVVHEETKASRSFETSGPVKVAPPEMVMHTETGASASYESDGAKKTAPVDTSAMASRRRALRTFSLTAEEIPAPAAEPEVITPEAADADDEAGSSAEVETPREPEVVSAPTPAEVASAPAPVEVAPAPVEVAPAPVEVASAPAPAVVASVPQQPVIDAAETHRPVVREPESSDVEPAPVASAAADETEIVKPVPVRPVVEKKHDVVASLPAPQPRKTVPAALARQPVSAPKQPSAFARLFGAFSRDDDEKKPATITADNSVTPLGGPTREEKMLLDLINIERTSRGLNPVVWDGTLARIARLHAADMSSVHSMTHKTSTDGANFETRLARTSYGAMGAAENIAYNVDVRNAHHALMNSPGHRQNILDPDYTAVGPGVVTEANGNWIYVAEDFATPMSRMSDAEAAQRIRQSISNVRSRVQSAPLPEDPAMSRMLSKSLEKMIASGAPRETKTGTVGWTMSYTATDPSVPPAGALEHVSEASSYAVAVTFRKSKKYPFGTYWAIIFLSGEQASSTTASAKTTETPLQ